MASRRWYSAASEICASTRHRPGKLGRHEPVPVNNYVDGLIRIYPFEDREELLYGPIQDRLGEMVVDLIEWQGHMRPEYWEHPSS